MVERGSGGEDLARRREMARELLIRFEGLPACAPGFADRVACIANQNDAAELAAMLQRREAARRACAEAAQCRQAQGAAIDAAALLELSPQAWSAYDAIHRYSNENVTNILPALKATPLGAMLKELSPREKAELLPHLYARSRVCSDGMSWAERRLANGMNLCAKELLRANPPLSQAHFARLLGTMTASSIRPGFAPDAQIAAALERAAKAQELSPETRRALAEAVADIDRIMKRRAGEYRIRELETFRNRLQAMAGETEEEFRLPHTLWTFVVERHLKAQSAEREKPLRALLRHAANGAGPTPAARWVAEARALVADKRELAGALLDWVEALNPQTLLAAAPKPATLVQKSKMQEDAERLPRRHGEIARRLMWLAALAAGAEVAPRLEKIGHDASRLKSLVPLLFSGAVSALGMLDGADGVPQLLSLRRKVKGLADAKTVEEALAELAMREQTSVEALSAGAVPTLGFEGAAEELRLPFESDGMPATILSKAFLLADDDGVMGAKRKTRPRAIGSQVRPLRLGFRTSRPPAWRAPS